MVVDTSSKVVGSNAEVVQILTFPEHPRNIHNLGAWLAKKVRSSLADGISIRTRQGSVSEEDVSLALFSARPPGKPWQP